MHRTNLRWLQTVTALLFAFAVPLLASDGPTDRQSLKGIKAVRVVIEHLDANEIADGLTVDQLQTDVELRLRKAGVTITSSDSAILYVNCQLYKRKGEGLYAFNCEMEFNQGVVTVLNGTRMLAATWSVAYLGTVGTEKMSQGVRESVGDLVDKFLNAYLSVNPK